MKNYQFIILMAWPLLAYLFSTNGLGAVWESKKQWNQAWELKYSQWVESDQIHGEIFSASDSPYHGLAVDCADLIFALRAIFAAENGLPFVVRISPDEIISNQDHWFDGIADDRKRLLRFIDYFLDDVGTSSLARLNSYPIDPRQLRPGDIYITQWRPKDEGPFTGHGHMIKEILPSGNLHLIYSTTPRAPRRLLERWGMPEQLPASDDMTAWGFRRLLTPDQLALPLEQLEDYSEAQYQLLKSADNSADFFEAIKSFLQINPESFEDKIKRQVKNLCGQLVQRVSLVDLALKELNITGRRSASRREYDLYSTPALDRSIFNGIKRVISTWNEERPGRTTVRLVGPDHNFSQDNQEDISAPSKLKLLVDHLKGVDSSLEAKQTMENFCHIPIGYGKHFTLRDYFWRYSKGIISSNPNHRWDQRWGLRRTR